MSLAEKIMTAWNKTMETGDAEHLSQFLSDDFVFINNVDEENNRAEVLDWSVNGGLRIGNFTTIYEDKKVFCAKHRVTQGNTGPSSVMVFAKHENGKATFWKIHRAFE